TAKVRKQAPQRFEVALRHADEVIGLRGEMIVKVLAEVPAQVGTVRAGHLDGGRRSLVAVKGRHPCRQYNEPVLRQFLDWAAQLVRQPLLAEGLRQGAAAGVARADKDNHTRRLKLNLLGRDQPLVDNLPAVALDANHGRTLTKAARSVINDQFRVLPDGFR